MYCRLHHLSVPAGALAEVEVGAAVAGRHAVGPAGVSALRDVEERGHAVRRARRPARVAEHKTVELQCASVV